MEPLRREVVCTLKISTYTVVNKTTVAINNKCNTPYCFTQDALIQDNGYCWSCNKSKQGGVQSYEDRILALKKAHEKGLTVKEQSLEEYILHRNRRDNGDTSAERKSPKGMELLGQMVHQLNLQRKLCCAY